MKINCPHEDCPGKIERYRIIETEQIIQCCTETFYIWPGSIMPQSNTPTELEEKYQNMLGYGGNINTGSHFGSKRGPFIEPCENAECAGWDVKGFFQHKYNPHNSILSTKNIFGDLGITECTWCKGMIKTATMHLPNGDTDTYEIDGDRTLMLFTEKRNQSTSLIL